MKIEKLIDAIGQIKPEYIKEAETWKPSEKKAHKRKGILQFKSLKRLLPVAACVCLLAAGGVYGLLNDGGAATEESTGALESMEEAAEDSAGEGGMADGAAPQDAADEAGIGEAESAAGAVQQDRIIINEVKEFSGAVYCGVEPSREEFYTSVELQEYYGVRILPEELPEGLVLSDAEEQTYRVAYNEKDEVMDDNNKLIYQNAKGDRKLEISVRTTESGEITSFADADLEASVIGGKEVAIGHYREGSTEAQSDGYLATFEKAGVSFTVQSTGLSEEEILLVLRGLVSP